jgi:hypothetical protein
MDAILALGGGEQKLRSYWSRPGGPLKTLIALAGFCIGGYYLFPILSQIVWDGVHLAIGGIVLLVIWFLFTNKALRLRLQAIWDILMNYTVGLIFTWDPWILAEEVIKDMINQRERVNDLLTNEVGKQKELAESTLNEKIAEAKKCRITVETGRGKKGYEDAIGNAARQAQRCDEFVKDLTPIYQNVCRVYNYLDLIYKKSAYMIEDAKQDLEMKKQKYNIVSAMDRALNAATRLFKGDLEKQLMRDQSMIMLKDSMAQKVSSMKRAISGTAEYMKTLDLETASSQNAGLEFLETFNPDEEFKLVADASKPMETIAAGQVRQASEYDNLIK